jgi:hypothetical protein
MEIKTEKSESTVSDISLHRKRKLSSNEESDDDDDPFNTFRTIEQNTINPKEIKLTYFSLGQQVIS